MTSVPDITCAEEIKAWLNSKRSFDAGIKLFFKYSKDPLLTLLFQETYSEFKSKKIVEVLEALITAPVAKASEEKKATTFAVSEITHMSDAIEKAIHENIEKHVAPLLNKQDNIEDDFYTLEGQVEDIAGDQNKLFDGHDELKKEIDQLKKTPKFIPRGWPPVMDETIKALHDEWLPKFTEKKFLQATIWDVAVAGQQDPAKKTEAGAMAHKILDLRDEIRRIYQKRDYYLQHNKLPEEPQLMELSANPNTWPTDIKNYERYIRDYKVKLAKNPNHATAAKQIKKFKWAIEELHKRKKK